jgi:hypothetical protein
MKVTDTGATAVIHDNKIEISIAVDALPLIVSGSCAANGLEGLWRVTDADMFATEVALALNREEEDGTTLVHKMFDKAFGDAIDQGADGIEEVDEESFEAEASRLRELAAAK